MPRPDEVFIDFAFNDSGQNESSKGDTTAIIFATQNKRKETRVY